MRPVFCPMAHSPVTAMTVATSNDLTGGAALPMFPAAGTRRTVIGRPAKRPLNHWVFMNLVVVELPAKAKTINKYLGQGYEVLASFGHVRDLPAKDGSVDPDARFPHDLGGRRQGAEAAQRHRPRRQGRRQADPRDRPGSRGRSDLLARARSAQAEEGAARTRRSSASCSTPSPSRP